MKYIYGPVKSRRLGLSLGISLAAYKICNFDCIYCQLGEAKQKINSRGEYAKTEEILAELKLWLQNNNLEAGRLNYITLSGSGEPTLNIKIGQIIAEIKKIIAVPVAVITNSSLLSDAMVRQSLSTADLIIPSLDAVRPETFIKIDQPAEGINLERIIRGLIDLRKEFRGKVWLEIMLVKGVNDDLAHMRKLKDIIDRIMPDKVQLNSPIRSSRDAEISTVGRNKLEKIKEILGENCEII